MTKQEVSEHAARYTKSLVVFVSDGITQLAQNPSEHFRLGAGWLFIGLATFVLLSLTGHRSTRQGPRVASAIILAWPLTWTGIFLHAVWSGLVYFLWEMWKGD